jgi:hypothetical protein
MLPTRTTVLLVLASLLLWFAGLVCVAICELLSGWKETTS